MANLRDFTRTGSGGTAAIATDTTLGVVKGGGDTHINPQGQIEIVGGYGGPFKVTLQSITSVSIAEGRVHNGTAPEHTIITKSSSTLSITASTLNAIWMVIDEDGAVTYAKTNSLSQGPIISETGTYSCILLAVVSNAGVVQQVHFGDVIMNGLYY